MSLDQNSGQDATPRWLLPDTEPDKSNGSAPSYPTLDELFHGLVNWARGLRADSWILGFAILAGILLCFGTKLRSMCLDWTAYSDYHHGALVPLIVLWFCWRRTAQLAAIERRPSTMGLVPLGIGLLLRWIGEVIIVPALSLGAFLVTVWGVIWCYWGPRMARALLFPVAFLVFMIPVPFPILAMAGFPLQSYSAISVASIGHFMGLPIVRDGTILSIYDFNAEVAQECSGLHSLFALAMVGTLVAAEMQVPIWKKCLMVALILPIVFGANVFRILLTVITATLFGPSVAEGMFHWVSGIILFGVAVFAFLYVRQWLAIGWRRRPTGAPAAEPLPPMEWNLGTPRW